MSNSNTPLQLEFRPEVSTYSVEDLLIAVKTGQIRIPPFQRPMRWQEDDKIALFDSIWRGFPVGTLLFWRRPGPAETLRLGNLEIRAPERALANYVFDGQQRISTLAQTAFLIPQVKERSIFYNIYNRKFEWARVHEESPQIGLNIPCNEESTQIKMVPAGILLDTNSLTEWLVTHATSLKRMERQETIDVGRRLREYRIPVFMIETSSDATLRTIFERVNRAGRRLTDAEVFHALYATQSSQDAGLETLQNVPNEMRWGLLEEDMALLIVRAVEGLPVREALSASLSAERMQQALHRSRKALRSTVSFLKDRSLIPHHRFSPYRLPIVVLSRFFDAFPSPSERTFTLLRRWLWRGLTALRLEAATVELRRHLAAIVHGKEDESVQNLLNLATSEPDPGIYDSTGYEFRTARSRLQVCALAARSPRDLATSLPLDLSELAAQTAPPLVRLTGEEDPASDDLAIRLLHPKLPRAALIHLLFQASELTLRSHLISRSSLDALRRGDEEAFVQQRRAEIEAWLRSFLVRMAERGADDSPPLPVLSEEED